MSELWDLIFSQISENGIKDIDKKEYEGTIHWKEANKLLESDWLLLTGRGKKRKKELQAKEHIRGFEHMNFRMDVTCKAEWIIPFFSHAM
ncbi:unnamed protein product [Dovyalis caffra]|uniref:Uncharacterized protein n=1 Tax=Dovyalis caffra TaxID=77055 RepID=A0AAV1S1Q2_9ROSI|nr:unnamed protein product [Dovyalis caffra]